MQNAPAPTGPVLLVSGAVTIDGTPRPASSISVTRALATDLPGEVVGGGEIVGATAQASLAEPHAVVNPWAPQAGWPPMPAQPAKVDVSAGGTTVRALTGAVDSASGALSNPSRVSVNLVDDIDRFRRSVNVPPRSAALGPNPTALGVLAEVAAQCGYSTTHPTSSATSLALPCAAGSLAPTVGTAGATVSHARWVPEAWGVAPADASIQAVTAPAATGQCLDVTFDVGAGTQTGSSADVTFYPFSYPYQVPYAWVVQSSRTTISVGCGGAGSVSYTRKSAWTRVRVRTVRLTSTTYWVGLWAWEVLSPPVRAASLAPVGSVTVAADKAVIKDGQSSWMLFIESPVTHSKSGDTMGLGMAGFVADVLATPATYQTIPYDALVHAPNLRLALTPSLWQEESPQLAASPAIVDRVASEVIKEIAGAVLAAVWLGEDGTLNVVGRHTLRRTAPVANLTSKRSLLELGWDADLSALRHQVSVTSKQAAVTAGVTAWVAPALTLNPGEVYEEFVHPADGVDWVAVDTVVHSEATEAAVRAGSRYGTVLGNNGSKQTLTATITRLDARTYKVTVTAPKTNTAPVTNLLSASYVEESLRGCPSPVIRAGAVLTWGDATTVGTPVGPDRAPDLVHDAGPWVQNSGWYAKEPLANALAAQLTTPVPRVENLAIVPDPRLQLADRVTVTDDVDSGVVIDGIIAGIDLGVSSGTLTQSITLRVLSTSVKGPTWDDFDALWAGGTWDDFDATWADKTWNDFDTKPLQRLLGNGTTTTTPTTPTTPPTTTDPTAPSTYDAIQAALAGKTYDDVDQAMAGKTYTTPPA